MATWFFKTGETVYGPVSAALLKKYVDENWISPETPVRQSTDGAWIQAKKIRGLFAITAEVVQEKIPQKSIANKLSLKGSLNCPQCGSENTQKVSVIYFAGTTSSESDSRGGAMGYDFQSHTITPMIGGAKTKTFQQTELARRVAPPLLHDISKPPSLNYSEEMLGVGCVVLWIFLSFLLYSCFSMFFPADWHYSGVEQQLKPQYQIMARISVGLAMVIASPICLLLFFKNKKSAMQSDDINRTNTMEKNARLEAENTRKSKECGGPGLADSWRDNIYAATAGALSASY